MSNKKIPVEESIDPTEARRERCFPVVDKIIKEIVDRDLLYSDMPYVQQRVMEGLQIVFQNIIIDHFNEIFELLHISLDKGLILADNILWDKNKDEITIKDIEDVLKKEDDLQKGEK